MAQSEKSILFVGGVHGDEPEGVRLAEELLRFLIQSEEQGLETCNWQLIPCLNPDGFSKNERTNGNGVDLNRNFPCRDWSSDYRAPRYYPGPQPNSEPEVRALVSLIEETQPKLIVHFHSWLPCIVYTGSAGKNWAEVIGENCGYEVREDIGYPTPGSLGQYAWLEHQIPVVCVEAQERSVLDEVWPKFSFGLQNLVLQKRRSI